MSMKISIHAPARGGDHRPPCVYQEPHHFNPRPREGGRRFYLKQKSQPPRFQSTPPRGGATVAVDGGVQVILISIHAPARGGDTAASMHFVKYSSFQSTPPRGGATHLAEILPHLPGISIHAPARGGDDAGGHGGLMGGISIHAPARGGDGPTVAMIALRR